MKTSPLSLDSTPYSLSCQTKSLTTTSVVGIVSSNNLNDFANLLARMIKIQDNEDMAVIGVYVRNNPNYSLVYLIRLFTQSQYGFK
jgi:hypothetical protein